MKSAARIAVPIALALAASLTLLPLPRTQLVRGHTASGAQSHDIIASYARWHSQQLGCLNSSTCDPPLLIWQCPQHDVQKCAGLGDRMRGVQFALLLAVLTQRVFLLDWPADPFAIQSVVQPTVIDWSFPSKRLRTEVILDWYACNEGNVCNNITQGRFPSLRHLPVMTAPHAQRLRDVNLLEDDVKQRLQSFRRVCITQRFHWRTTMQLLHAYNSRHGSRLFAELSELQLQRALTQALFQPSEAVKRRMNAFGLQHSTYVAVHIRTGRDFNEADNRFSKMLNDDDDDARVAARVLHALKQVQPSHVVYVASDSRKLKQQLQKAARRQQMRVVSCDGEALHIAKIGLKRDMTKARKRRQLRRMFERVFVDLFMLSRARALLSSGSGFSNAAHMLASGAQQFVRLRL